MKDKKILKILELTHTMISGDWKRSCICDTILNICYELEGGKESDTGKSIIWESMNNWLNVNLPPKVISMDGTTSLLEGGYVTGMYCWPHYEKEPRLEWLEEQIQILKTSINDRKTSKSRIRQTCNKTQS